MAVKVRPLHDRLIVDRIEEDSEQLEESSFLTRRKKNHSKAKSSPREKERLRTMGL